MLRHHHFNHTDIFEEDTKLKCLEDFSFFLRFLFINLGYVEFDMSHYNHVTFQSFSLIEQSTSETISTSGHWLPVWPPLPVALLLLVFGCCCCWYKSNSSDVFTNLFHGFFLPKIVLSLSSWKWYFVNEIFLTYCEKNLF